jgi:uracil-DNA glycosylase family 4
MRDLDPSNTFVGPQVPNPGNDLVRLVIAEAPGSEEAEQGQPLVGGCGKEFNKLLRAAGIPRDGLTITNCLSCRPPHNVFPTDRKARSYISKADGEAVVAHCKHAHLDPLLASRPWTRIDLVGDKALRLVAGRMGGITQWRGSPLTLPTGQRAIAILHPRYLMLHPTMQPDAENDLKKSLDERPEP